MMFAILNSSTSTLIIDKSRFIAVTFHVRNGEEVKRCLSAIKKEYPKARHYCYAYIIGAEEKGFDDGEPARTAGRPLLELLKRGQFDQTLIVVIRYFGGTLLGASRLLRAYVAVANEALSGAEKHEIVHLFSYALELAYSDYEYLLSEAKKRSYILENSVFSDTIMIKLLAREPADDFLQQTLHGRGKITPLEMERRYLKETST